MNEKFIGPFTFDVKVHVENHDERTIGAVTIGLAPGRVPTIEALHRAIGQALAALPDGYALLDGEDFFNRVLVKEKTGRIGNFAVPSSYRYDLAALDAAARDAYKPEPVEEVEADDDDEWLDEEGE